MTRMRSKPVPGAAVSTVWQPLDEWMKGMIDEWDAKLPRELALKFDSKMVGLKAVELGIPRPTDDAIERYSGFLYPVRDAVNQNLTDEEWNRVRAHDNEHRR